MIERTLSEIAELCGARLEGDGERVIVGPASLEEAGPDEISFLAKSRYAPQLEATRAAAVIVGPEVRPPREGLALLRSDDPNAAFTRVVEAFTDEPARPAPGVHPSAVVDETARLGSDVSVGPLCVVAPGAEIGDGALLLSRVHVGEGARVGPATVLHPGVVLYPRVVVGARCILHANCVLGADGFGFDPTAEGWAKVPQCGTVVLGDEVEMGAGSTVDRARFGATRIGNGAKIDNLVQIGHNCVVGDGVLLCAQVGLAGSARVGPRAVLGGQVGVNGHILIGAGARVGGKSGVHGDLEPDTDYFGIPCFASADAMKSIFAARRLPRLLERVRELEKRLRRLEGGSP